MVASHHDESEKSQCLLSYSIYHELIAYLAELFDEKISVFLNIVTWFWVNFKNDARMI